MHRVKRFCTWSLFCLIVTVLMPAPARAVLLTVDIGANTTSFGAVGFTGTGTFASVQTTINLTETKTTVGADGTFSGVENFFVGEGEDDTRTITRSVTLAGMDVTVNNAVTIHDPTTCDELN